MSVQSAFAQAKRTELDGLVAQIDALQAKGVLTAEESKTLTDARENLPKVHSELKASIESDAKLAEAKTFLNGDQSKMVPISSDTAKLLEASGSYKAVIDKALAERTSWLGLAGHDLTSISSKGHLTSMESEGWCVEAKQWKSVCEPTYMKTFEKFLRRGVEKMDQAEMKTLSEGSDGGGGYLVPPQFIARLIARKPYPTRILEFVDAIPCSSDQVYIPRLNYDSDTADIYSAASPRIQWTGEKGPTPAQADMQFGNVVVPIFTGQFYVEVTRNLTEDIMSPVGAIIERFASQAYELGLDNVVVAGDGNGKPTGLLTNAGGAGLYCPTVNCGNPVSANGLTGLVYGLPPQYSDTPSTAALMNRTSGFSAFAQIQDTSGQYIFGLARENGPEGMAVARRPELFGYPTIFSAFMPNVGSTNSPVAFGDIKEAYTLCQRVGLSVESYGLQDRSMLQRNAIGWFFRFRAGGMVTQSRAVHVGVQS